MKRYTQIALYMLIAQFTALNVVYAMQTNEDPNFIVNKITRNSDLSEADENQYNLLWLGSLGTAGSFLAGAAATIGAGVGAYQKAGALQPTIPEPISTEMMKSGMTNPRLLWLRKLGTTGDYVADTVSTFGAGRGIQKAEAVQFIPPTKQVYNWVTNPLVLAGLGSLGAGYISYRILYPRIRAGVLNKVQKFIDVCEKLENDSPRGANILNSSFNNIDALQASLPQSWLGTNTLAIYNALFNLLKQAQVAKKLLEYIGISDSQIQEKYRLITGYIVNLSYNEGIYKPSALLEYQKRMQEEATHKNKKNQDEQEEYARKQKLAMLANVQANTDLQQQGAGLTRATKIEKWMNIAGNILRNFRNGVNYTYQNFYNILGGTAVGVASGYGLWHYMKYKLGFAGQ